MSTSDSTMWQNTGNLVQGFDMCCLMWTHRLWPISKVISFEHLQELIRVRISGQNMWRRFPSIYISKWILRLRYLFESNCTFCCAIAACHPSNSSKSQKEYYWINSDMLHFHIKSNVLIQHIISYDQMYQLTWNACWSLTHLLVAIQQVREQVRDITVSGTLIAPAACIRYVGLMWSLLFEWYTARLVIKNGSTTKRHIYQRDCTMCSEYVHHFRFS